MHGQDIDYTNHDFFLGIDVHQKNWKVTIRANRMQLKTFSMDPSPEQLLLRKYCREYGIQEEVKNLRRVPGVGFVTAMTIYGELMDMSRFRSIDQLASYVGLVPSISASGERESSLGLSFRRNRYLRYLLIEAAWVAVREDPALGYVFSQLIKRMTKQKAIVRIAKKLLNRIRYVWKHKESYAWGLIS